MARRKRWRAAATVLPVVLMPVLMLAASGVWAADPPTAAAVLRTEGRTQTEADPIVANVDGHPIHLAELGLASDSLAENLRGLPFDALYPVLLERMIDHTALVMMARRQGLDEDPNVRREVQAAVDRVLEAAYLRRTAAPTVTEAAIRARYDQEFGSRPATEEVRARHILVATEAQARDVLAQLKAGADFAALAAKLSQDPDGKRGGDLGFFRREQVWPGFADVAFSLQPGQVGQQPVRNEFGWHVVRVEERRLVAPPSLEDAREGIRQELMAQAVRSAVAAARASLEIHEFNADGTSRLNQGPRPAGQQTEGKGP
jgi:peptidyl-prolyl cis-trans isomerase C